MLLEKTYRTDTLPSVKKKNNGERDQFYVTDSHDAIISRDEFEKVQQLMSKMAVRYKPERKNKYIIGSILECGECG